MSVHRIKDLDHEILAYVLTYNAPLQLRAFFESARAALCGLERYRVIVVNQSDRDETTDAYQQICNDFLAAHVRTQNAGASGGRKKSADHFHRTSAAAMFYFEDDILFHDAANRQRCRFGFPAFVPDVLSRTAAVLKDEQLDYLKLNFHEHFFDHSRNFVTNQPSTFNKLGHAQEVAYLVGDVYFSNWPMLITQKASRALFAPPISAMTEGAYVELAHRFIHSGQFRTGVLAAWPMGHDRQSDRGEKVDSVPTQQYEQHSWTWLSLGRFEEPIGVLS